MTAQAKCPKCNQWANRQKTVWIGTPYNLEITNHYTCGCGESFTTQRLATIQERMKKFPEFVRMYIK